MTPPEKLTKEGWKKVAAYDDPRLSEVVEIYQEIGFEVHLEPFHAANESECTSCMKSTPDAFKTIYTRRKTGKKMANDE